MRGNHSSSEGSVCNGGSIPARAGEPSPTSISFLAIGVYPRACGGTLSARRRRSHHPGLSSRVRGNRSGNIGGVIQGGSILARAGEPTAEKSALSVEWVYPRACGGTHDKSAVAGNLKGLSSRVRGNRVLTAVMSPVPGSILARAGEPMPGDTTPSCPRVYPRACGGTSCNQVLEFP